ncbi:hypothetical protein L7F22_013525 [Adiantum nelumboides]|nr:hypothetical protein [Adiantum nelumboides]
MRVKPAMPKKEVLPGFGRVKQKLVVVVDDLGGKFSYQQTKDHLRCAHAIISRAMPAMDGSYCIKSLSAPMRLSATGEVCRRIHITQGTALTIGRSNKSCDVTFSDARVSRKHCQLRLLPHSNTLLLLDGATTSDSCWDVSHFVESLDVNRLHSPPQMNKPVLGDASIIKGLPEDLRNIQNASKLKRKGKLVHYPQKKHRRIETHDFARAVGSHPVVKVSCQWKPSLNGIFVNGHEFSTRVMVLVPGDEVSLVGPTNGGKSFDSECSAAIGFVVEAEPMGQKAPTTTSCLSLKSITEHTIDDKFSAPDMACISHDGGHGSFCKLIAFNDRKDRHPEIWSVSRSPYNQYMGTVTVGNPDERIRRSVSDTQAADLSTNQSIKPGSADPVQGKNPRSLVSLDLQAVQVTEASSSVELDHKLLSAFNLVNSSVKLRSDLLNCYTAKSIQAVAEQTELPLMTAEKGVNCTQEITIYNNYITETTTVPTIDNVSELCDRDLVRHAGDPAKMKDVFFSLEHIAKLGSILSPQTILPNDILTKNSKGYDMSVLEKDASVSPIPAPPSRRESLLKGPSLVDNASINLPQFTRTLLVSPSNHTARVTDMLSQMFDAVLSKRSVVNSLPPAAANGNHLEEFVSGNPHKENSDVLQATSLRGVNDDKTLKTGLVCEHSFANDTGPMMVKADVARLTVMQVNEERQGGLKESLNGVHNSDNGCTMERILLGQPLNVEPHSLDDGRQLNFTKDGQAFVHVTNEQTMLLETICCQSSQMDVASSECTVKVVGSVCGNGNFTTVDNLSSTGYEIVPVKKVQSNTEVMDVGASQREETCAVQNIGCLEKFCSLHVQQHLECTCSLGSSKTEVEVMSVKKVQGIMKSLDTEDEQRKATYSAQEPKGLDASCSTNVEEHGLNMPIVGACHSGLEEVDFCKKDALKCTVKGVEVQKGFECSVLVPASNKEELFATLQPDHGVQRVVCKEFNNDRARLDDGATLETDKTVGRHDLCCSENLAVNAQVDAGVNTFGSKIEIGGYYLNQLEDVAAADNTVHLWKLLALSDDVQALFIATFTYDIEWFLASGGLSRDIPVTVACHDARRCWSKASKDRCEKPFLDWPNVTLVYPPFPRSNAIGSKGQGIGCHHPKIFLVRRSGSLRVIVSSANLTYKQWFHVTNNVWWQDFSCRKTPDFRCLFRGENKSKSSSSPDFASQLAMFLAALLVNVPSESHWVTDLAAFDFSDADGSLVASVPGLHHPLYQNAPQFLTTLDKEVCYPSLQGDDIGSSFLGVVPTTVAGIKYRFCPSADRNGKRIRCLAAALSVAIAYEGSTMPVLLKRAKFLKADPNAVSVVVTSRANNGSQDLFLQQDLHDTEINTMETDVFDTEKGFIKLGFLTRDVASWLAILCDQGFFSFAACIWPSEALAVASGQCDGIVKLALYVFQGPKFSTLSPTVMTSEECGAFSRLLKSLQNTWGLWRLEKVLCRYNWVHSFESDFYVASSSMGTSLDAKFLAAFEAAAGRRVDSSTLSQESDPQWGCWTAEQEAANPSIGIVFPTIDRVRQANFLHLGLLCFAESAWLRLKPARLLHDAVPHPPEREGFPMHIKVARQTFRDPLSFQAYGWMYCGSHNFSPAAWGRPVWRAADWEAATDAGSVLGSALHICNYELGIVLIEPPPNEDFSRGKKEPSRRGLDRFVLPFQVPPPMYKDEDRPATGKAMMEALMEMRALQLKAAEEDVAVMQSEDGPEEACLVQQEGEAAGDADREEVRAEQAYVGALWSQLDDEDKKAKELV